MQIVIVLLSVIVAFLLGGPLISLAVLLIGLIIVFPNAVGIVAAIIGLIVLFVKLDINVYALIGILAFIFLILGLIGLLAGASKKEYFRERHKNKKILDNLEAAYNLIETNETEKIVKYHVEPNTDDVWTALKNLVVSHGKWSSYKVSSLEPNSLKMKYNDEQINLERNEKGIELLFKNVQAVPYFIKKPNNIEKKELDNATETTIENEEHELDNTTKNYIDDLVKLSNLLKEDLITEEEYSREKKKLLK